MKNQSKTSLHNLLLVGAFILALAFRLVNLEKTPLQNMEAEVALQGMAMARGSDTDFGQHLIVASLTSLNFMIFSTSLFFTRFFSAFFGAMIVLVPFLFRKQSGLWVATLTSFVLAIAPDMVGLSRVMGSPMASMVCLLLAAGFLFLQKPTLLGVMLALGLMSGADFWLGLSILLIAILATYKLTSISEIISIKAINYPKQFFLRSGGAFSVTLAVVGTGFFMSPSGLSGIFSGLVAFIRGFGTPYFSPYLILPLALIAYASPAIILGLWGSLRGVLAQDQFDLFLLAWWLVGLVVILVYPGSRPEDMIWVSMPLWVLSVRAVYFNFSLPDENRLIVAGTAVLVIVFSAFMLLAMRSWVNPNIGQDLMINYLIALIGGGVLLIAIVLLVNFGWSDQIALAGLLIGIIAVMIGWFIATTVNATSLNGQRSYELWFPDEPHYTTEWMTLAIDRVFLWNRKGETPVMIAVSGLDTPSMAWALRAYPSVAFVDFLQPGLQPGIVITKDQEKPELTSGYRGQDLVWSSTVLWQDMNASDFLSWLVIRNAPIQNERMILWVRTDLMPDNQFTPIY